MNKKSLIRLFLIVGVGLSLVSITGFSASLRKTKPARPKPAQHDQSRGPQGQSATVLPDGRVLLLGGDSAKGPLQTASIQDPQSGTITVLSVKLQEARAWHSATLLPNGTVFIFGGVGTDGSPVNIAESFNPTSMTFQTLQPTGMTPRAHHTATLLTSGLVFVAGGQLAGGATTGTAQLWDFQANAVTNLSHTMVVPRHDQTATLQADGTVLLWGGIQGNGLPAPAGELFDPVSETFQIETSRSSPTPVNQMPQLEASIPDNNADNVAVNILIAMRFSKPLQVKTVNSMTVTVSDVQGNVPAEVIPAEGGMLAFVTPNSVLLTGTSYTVTLSGITDESGLVLPDTTFSFTTAGAPQNGDTGILGNTDWPGGPQASPWAKLPPLQARPGVTALSGQVLLQDGHPLANVTLRIGTLRAKTDDTGRFLLRDAPSGHSAMVIDGHSADTKKATYGVFEDGVDLVASQTTSLTYKIWMPVIDTAHAVRIAVPTLSAVVVTSPLIPGLEFHIPAGTTIDDIDGNPVREVSITPIPVSQPPFPLPTGVNVPTYFTIQPGGGYVSVAKTSTGPDGGWLVYPNTFHQPVGTQFDFWDYDADKSGWWIYGHGSVSANGASVVPNPGVYIYELTGAMVASSGTAPSSGPDDGDDVSDGDPVDLGTGLYVFRKVDLSLPDVIPITLTRTYRPNDAASRAFGVGTSHPYDIFLVGDVSPYTYQDLVLENGSRIHFTRISTGTAYTDAVYQCNSSPGPFFGSTIKWNGSGGIAWTLTRRDGTSYNFPDGSSATRGQQAALLTITDRNGNVLTITRDSNANITEITSPNGRWLQFTYDSSYRITQVQDNIGRTVQYSYDSGGRLTSVVDANAGTWGYSYDSSNNMTSLVDARGITYLQNQFDSQNRVTMQTLANGTSTYQFSYNPGTCSSNCSGIWETDVTNPNGNLRKYDFNSATIFANGYTTGGSTSSITLAAGSTIAQTFSYLFQTGTNLPTSITDPLARVTAYTYDSLGNIASSTKMSGTIYAATTVLAYDALGQIVSVTDPLGHTASMTRDSKGNMTALTDPNGNTSRFTYDSEGRTLSVVDPLSETTTFSYIGPDLTALTDPLGRNARFNFDAAGRLVSEIDTIGGVTKYSYDGLDQITQITDPMLAVMSYGYDGNGNRLSAEDSNSQTTAYTYDSMDLVATRTDALSNSESYNYDAAGNLTQFTDRRGKLTNYTYDALDRKSFAGYGYTAGPIYESTISYSYDAGNRATSIVDSVSGTITRTYDGFDLTEFLYHGE